MAGVGSPEDPLAHFSQEEVTLFLQFLVLIRDNYAKADKASHFLERRAGVANTCGIANLRDVLSHLATLLNPQTPADKRSAQVASAEEHLRRAIIEPYELAVAALSEKFSPIYDGYRETVIPLAGVEGFRTAPARLSVDSRLEEINQMAELGKLAKARNQWDDDWESGVAALIDAFNKFADLHGEIEEWVYKRRQYDLQLQAAQAQAQANATAMQAAQTARHHTGLHRWGIAWTIIAMVVGLIGGVLIARYSGWIAIPVRDPQTASPKP